MKISSEQMEVINILHEEQKYIYPLYVEAVAF